MSEFNDGETLEIGVDLKALANITFVGATMPGPSGEKLLVVIKMELRPALGRPLETVLVSVPADQFAALAELFRTKADQLARNTTPKAPLQ